MFKDINEYVNSCELCLKIKTRAPIHNGLLRPIETKRPFELIGIDIAYLPISKGGFRYILVAIDYFTNWVEAALLKSMTAEEVIRAFFKIISDMGAQNDYTQTQVLHLFQKQYTHSAIVLILRK